jgi:hypothetical protein
MSFNPQNYQFSLGEHRDKSVVFVHFPYDLLRKDELRDKFPTVKWSVTNKCWYLSDSNAVRKEIGLAPKTEVGKAVINQIHPVNQIALKRMHETLLLKGYSPNTIKTYCTEFAQLLYVLKDINVDTLTPQRLRSYLVYCVSKLKLSENVIHSRMNAIKFYFEQVLRREKFFFEEIPRPKKRLILPKRA